MTSTTSPTLEEYISSLSSRYTTLQDTRTISGITTSRKFNSYVYTRKLLIRKTLEDGPTHHKIYCTHCTNGMWVVDAKSTCSSLQLRHLFPLSLFIPMHPQAQIGYHVSKFKFGIWWIWIYIAWKCTSLRGVAISLRSRP